MPSRPEVRPPPHWRLEAVAAVERPRHPDVHGKRVAFVIDRDSSDIWVLDRTDGVGSEPQRWTTDRSIAAFWEDAGPRWSPDGTTIAYTNSGSVWLTDGGPGRKLCEGGSPVWIDDRRLVVEVERPSEAEPNGRTVLGLVSVESGWVAPLLECAGDLGSVAIAPGARRLAAVHSPRADLNASRIVVAAFDGDALVEIDEIDSEPAMHDVGPAWSPDGESVVFTSESPGWYRAFGYHLGDRERRLLSDGEGDLAELAWGAAGIIATCTRHGVGDLVLIHPETGEIRTLAEGGVWSNPVWFGDSLVAAHEAPDTAPRLVQVVMSESGVSIEDLSRPTPVAVRSAPHVLPEHVWYPAPEGPVPAFLYRPAGSSADAPCAVIVHPHGGPTSHYGAEWDGIAQYFLDKGYAWLAPNFKGSTSYGRDHERANHGNWATVDTQDCLAAHAWLADQEWVDERRIAIFGASYGSYLALLSVVDGDRFACAVAKYGDCDILTSWAQGDLVGRLDLERMMGHPGANPQGYRTGSPIHRIESISAPILIAHGEQDARVHPAQSEELVEALRRVGATFDYVTYPSEGHGFLQREPFLDFYPRLERFLDWYLL